MTSAAAASLLTAFGTTGAHAGYKFGKGPGPASGSAAADFVFVDSDVTQLAGIKRVIIINYVISFQTKGSTPPWALQ
jgi:hypothetical protein